VLKNGARGAAEIEPRRDLVLSRLPVSPFKFSALAALRIDANAARGGRLGA
jgi:hypothetical protein